MEKRKNRRSRAGILCSTTLLATYILPQIIIVIKGTIFMTLFLINIVFITDSIPIPVRA